MTRVQQIVSSFCLLGLTQLAAAHPTSIGYVYDSQGSVVRLGSGGCLRTAEWAPENAIAECDSDIAIDPSASTNDPSLKNKSVVDPSVKRTAPVVVAKPAAPAIVKPAPIKIALKADDSFKSGKADLSANAKGKLNDMIKQLDGVTYDQITVVGHADRIGNAKSNQKLSERRANSVKAYLVKQGIPAAKIASNGVGSSQPVTTPADCGAKLKGKKLSACLAPDRRVEVNVTGTRAK